MLQGTVNAEAVSMTITRNIGGNYSVDGEYAPDENQPLPIMGTIQPATGRMLRDLDEGVRASADFTLWTTSAVDVGDIIAYAGANYRVLIVKHRPEGGFNRAILGKVRAA